MREVKVVLMETPYVAVDGVRKQFPYRKVEGLFYYICVKKRITRDEAVGVFWEDWDEQGARKNLRDAVYHIRKAAGQDVIRMEGNAVICLNPDLKWEIDLDRIRENILEHGSGEFLRYFYIKNCLEFDSWAGEWRRSLKESFCRAARQEAEKAMEEGNRERAVLNMVRLIGSLCLDEEFLRKLISFLIGQGDYSEALSVYEKFAQALKKDVDEEPEEETRELIRQALRRSRQQPPAFQEKKLPGFFGRERERAKIREALFRHEEKGAGAENFILITGEAGVGKTALLSCVKEEFQETRQIFSCSCCQANEELYLKPWIDLTRQLEESGRGEDSWPEQPKDYGDCRLFATYYSAYMESLLRALLSEQEKGSVILCFDDIQWMDGASLRMLETLLFRLRKEPFTVVAAARNDKREEMKRLAVSAMGAGLLCEISLSCFTLEETKEMVVACGDEGLAAPEKLELIYRHTDGNALFLTELLKTLKNAEGGAAAVENLKLNLTPRTLSIINSRLMAFNQGEREFLEILSVFPRQASVEEICILSREEERSLFQMAENLTEQQMIGEAREEGQVYYRFTHSLIQGFIYQRISEGRRRMYNREIAGFYEKKYLDFGEASLLPLLIFHFGEAGDVYKKYTYRLEYMKLFFTGKMEIYPELSSTFSSSLFFPQGEDTEEMLITLAEEIRALPKKDRRNRILQMKTEYLIGKFDLAAGDYRRGLRNLKACMEAAEEAGDGEYLMNARLQLIYYGIQAGEPGVMREQLDCCQQLLKTGAYSLATVFSVKRLEALYFMKMEEYEKASRILDRLIPEMEGECKRDGACRAGLSACYNYQGEISMDQRKWEEALMFIGKALACNPTPCPTAGQGVTYTDMGIILYQTGSYDQALIYFNKARECFQELSVHWGRAREEVYSALLELKLERPWQALSHYEAACRFAGKDRSPSTRALLREVYGGLASVPGLSLRPPEGFSDAVCPG